MQGISRRQWLAMTGAALAFPLAGRAQAPARSARVAWLGWVGGAGAKAADEPLAAFRDGLSSLGWKEGRNLVLATRAGEQSASRALATELVAGGIDALVCEGPMVFGARGAVAGALPIVFSINGDPVEAGLVASLARPGGNLTGVTALSGELSVKRVEFLKACAPGLSRLAAIANQSHPGVKVEYDATIDAAKRLGLALQWLPVYRVDDFPAAFDAATRERAGAIVAIPDNLINQQAAPIAAFCARQRIPAISGWAQFADAGNVLSYGPIRRAFYSRLAAYVDKLLRGARAADLPVERPTEFELVVNAKAAREIGLAIPQSVALRADRTIR